MTVILKDRGYFFSILSIVTARVIVAIVALTVGRCRVVAPARRVSMGSRA